MVQLRHTDETGLASVFGQRLWGNVRSRVLVIVPLYRNPELFRRLLASLVRTVDELKQCGASVLFLNDSPGDSDLSREIRNNLAGLESLGAEVLANDVNLGFLKTANRGLSLAIAAKKDAVLLNSDTEVFPGWITELHEAAYSDPMIGFVSPRSNNATICTSPVVLADVELSPEGHAARHWRIATHLPRLSYVPTAVGFCMYIKLEVLLAVGVLDEAFGRGYSEENDLVMRANALGFRATLANRAFVWHRGEASFSLTSSAKSIAERDNYRLLVDRHPTYPRQVAGYEASPARFAERLIGLIAGDASGAVSIAFDFSGFHAAHNGTAAAGIELMKGAVRSWPSSVKIVVICETHVAAFHRLDQIKGIRLLSPESSELCAAAVLKFGQPFSLRSALVPFFAAPVVACFMLDTIAYDIGSLRVELNEDFWAAALRLSDVVIANSSFTLEQLERRFAIGQLVSRRVSLHSLELGDYRPREIHRGGDQLLVVGNVFPHKAVPQTAISLAESFPERIISVLGADVSAPNIVSYRSGHLTDDTVEGLYSKAACLIFPSYYEGFGFPLLQALAREIPVYCRNLPPFREILDQGEVGFDNIHFFSTLPQLISMLKEGVAPWKPIEKRRRAGEGWERSALEVLRWLDEAISRSDAITIQERVRYARLISRGSDISISSSQVDRAAARVGRLSERMVRRVLRWPPVLRPARHVWKAALALRNTYKGI